MSLRASLDKAQAWMTTKAETPEEQIQQMRYAIWQIIEALRAVKEG